MNQSKLPADPLSIILGIIALVIIIGGCCCYGIPAIISLVLSIIGLVSANRSLTEYDANPEAYSHQSRSNVATARVINIIALIISSIVTLIMIGFIILYGSLLSFGMFDNYDYEFNNRNWDEEEQTDYEYDYEEEQIIEEDSLEQDGDSLDIDYEEAIYIEQRI
jgi:hypothetical protein